MNQGEAAESLVRMSLNGVETLVRISGSGVKGAVALMYALSKDNKQLKGKTSLKSMLKSGKELKVFSIREKDFEKFVKQAKKYGILYSALLDKKGKNLDGLVDIMVRAEDAPRINRIVDRFNLVSFDEAKIRAEINKDKVDKIKQEGLKKGVEVNDINDSNFVNEILNRNDNKENKEIANPFLAGMEKSSPSEPLLKSKKNLEVTSKVNKPSVRETIKKIKEEIKQGKTNNTYDRGKTTIYSDKKNKSKRSTKKVR